MPDQSFSIHLKSLLDFAAEFQTQIDSIQAPMDHLAALSGKQPQYGAFAEAWSLGAGEQAAVEEMHSLLGQVKQAIAFAQNVTGTVADGYQHADDNIASALGVAPPPPTSPPGHVVADGGGSLPAPDPSTILNLNPTSGTNPASGLSVSVTLDPTSSFTTMPVVDPASAVSASLTSQAPPPSWQDYFPGTPQGGA